MKLSFKEKYLIILIALCFIVVGLYYSYAIFVTKQLQENVVVVKTNNKAISLKISNNDNMVKVIGKTNQAYEVSIENKNGVDYYYLVMVKGIKTGIKVSSDDEITGLIKANEKKNIIININNTLSEDVTLEFKAKASNSELIDKDIEYSYINKEENFDHSHANKPEINNLNLIPVIYQKISDKEGYWVKTSVTNQDSLWYDYDNGIWANAVLLNDNNYNKYYNMENGTEIEIGDILGFYVWIPRFKYYIINSSNYTSYERITNIVFENGEKTTGTIFCQDKISNNEDNHVFSEVCEDKTYSHIYDNLSTYTHPSFKDKSGFWVSKFLMGEGEKILPNVKILKKNISDAYKISKNISKSHVLTNMEYAAIVLLSNSSYGKAGNKLYSSNNSTTFQRIYPNSYIYDVTGCSSEYNTYSKGFILSESKKCVEYNDLSNLSHYSNSINYPVFHIGAGASSTGTIYGVYDLASINGELVSAFLSDKGGNIDINTNYYDLYSFSDYIGKVASSSNVYNLYRYKMGDAIKEHLRSFSENGMWHNGSLIQNRESGVMIRGGSGNIKNASVYTTLIENIEYVAPFRLVLID